MCKYFYKGKNDAMFKAIFCKEENRDLLKEIIKEATSLDVEIISVSIPELKKEKVVERGKLLDLLVKAKNEMISIEVNSSTLEEFRRRNISFISKTYFSLTKKGETYMNMPKVIQINLTSDATNKIPDIAKYELYDKENEQTYIDNLEIYEINITEIKNKWYNKDNNKYKILSLLDCDKEELELLKGDELVEKFKKEVVDINNDKEFEEWMSAEEEGRLLRNTLKEIAYREGIEQGKKQGIQENNIKIAKELLKNNISIDIISKSTGLTKDEIMALNE